MIEQSPALVCRKYSSSSSHHHPYIYVVHFLTVNQLQRLLLLESQYGPLTGFTPALNDVLDYLQDVCLSHTHTHSRTCTPHTNTAYRTNDLYPQISKSEDPSDLKMRLAIYSLLSAEGSPRSQKVLTNSHVILNNIQDSVYVIELEIIVALQTPYMYMCMIPTRC